MVRATPTGRIRFRPLNRILRAPVLVVQVEERIHGYLIEDARGCGRDVDYLQWRDARTEDLVRTVPVEEGLL